MTCTATYQNGGQKGENKMNLVEMAVAEFGFFETGDKFVELQKRVHG
jgi:hypothetical protein